jgi:hypothetical protein
MHGMSGPCQITQFDEIGVQGPWLWFTGIINS